MLSILAWLTGLAGPISSIVNKLSDLQIAKTVAASSIEKARIDSQIEELHDKRAVLVADAGNRFKSIVDGTITALLAFPVALYLTKIFLWDKVIGSWPSFSTDPLDVNLWWVAMAVVGFFFLKARFNG